MVRKILFVIGFSLALSTGALIYNDGAALAKIGRSMPHYLIEKSWREARKTGEDVKPWPWLESHPVAKLTFPARRESLVVMAGVNNDVLNFAPGWHEGTEKPGESGISLISGRRDRQFGFLRDLKSGTVFELEDVDGRKTKYYVDNFVTTQVGEIFVPASDDESILLLSTTYPSDNWRGGKDLKYVVVAREYHEPPQMTSDAAAVIAADTTATDTL